MTPEQALRNLAQAARAFRGTFDEHQTLQQSVQILAKALGLSECTKSDGKSGNDHAVHQSTVQSEQEV